jgi:hypothetical protein
VAHPDAVDCDSGPAVTVRTVVLPLVRASRLVAFASFVALLALVACGSSGDAREDAMRVTSDAAASDAVGTDGAGADASTQIDAAVDAPLIDAPMIDAFPAVLDLRINCRNDCVLIANPPSITVPEGTSFQVNWINVGDTDCDVAKVDQFNQVPIIIGLEPGTSYHDSVRDWCGTQFTGTFNFRVSICTLHSYIPVDCGG